jgi:hypothetical protein
MSKGPLPKKCNVCKVLKPVQNFYIPHRYAIPVTCLECRQKIRVTPLTDEMKRLKAHARALKYGQGK